MTAPDFGPHRRKSKALCIPTAASFTARSAANSDRISISSAIVAQAVTEDIDVEAVIEHHFDGKRYLYDCFLQSFMQDFAADIHELRKAMLQEEMAKVVRLSHALKSALYMLGYEAAGSGARALEMAARIKESGAIRTRWRELKLLLKPILVQASCSR